MEDYMKIEQYLCCNPDTKIIKKKCFPAVGLILLFLGLVMVIISAQAKIVETLAMLMLTVGVVLTLVGVASVLVSCGKDAGYYVFQPTGSRMKIYRRYINSGDKRLCAECIASGKMEALAHVRKEVSSGSLLRVLLSKDGACAVMQMEEYIPHDFVPVTPVLVINNEDVSKVRTFLKS